ncbi:ATP-binding protein [Paraburkholderia sp. MM6662-R1]|uniref:ATP-binding protein n=1 Tax=Paraburkholderia sp. MM6662-R1 TaxID=2991066 RepID=UPI003D23D828
MKDLIADGAWRAMHSGQKTNGIAQLRSVAAISFVCGIGLAIATWVCFRLGTNFRVAESVYLIQILLLSLMDSLVASLIFSAIAVGCLDFFFAKPLFSLWVDSARDIAALIAFSLTSFLVTALVQRARGLAAVHHEQAQLLDLTHDSVVVRDMDDVITYWNNGAEALYGWKKHEAVGRTAQPLLRTRFPTAIEDIKKTLIAMGRWEGEIINTRRDGSQAAVASRWALVRDKQGRPIATLETGTDITERRRIEETLQRVSRLTSVGELGASVAHEIAQPLAAIATQAAACLRWLDRDTPNLERVHAGVQHILHDDQRATEIVRRIHMLATRAAPEMTRLEINGAINDVVALVQREVLKYNITLRTVLVPGLPAVLGDRIQLAQVITNLVMNAIQAMSNIEDRPRELVIESRRGDAGHVTISVQDSGTGIDVQHADRLFEPFFTTKPEGMGVGLSICHSIIDAHGGRVWAENNAGYGATFRFTIPVIGDSGSSE